MTLLLDTHALIWFLEADRRLSEPARTALTHPDTVIHVSAVSAWEIAIKVNQGRLRTPGDLIEQVAANRWIHLPISLAHGIAAGSLPLHHRDPFDRMLVAQAMAEGLTIVTRDSRIARYDVPTLRA